MSMTLQLVVFTRLFLEGTDMHSFYKVLLPTLVLLPAIATTTATTNTNTPATATADTNITTINLVFL